MAICRSCKHLTCVDRTVAPDRGWCEIWESWQKTKASGCKHYELKEYAPLESKNPRKNFPSKRDKSRSPRKS